MNAFLASLPEHVLLLAFCALLAVAFALIVILVRHSYGVEAGWRGGFINLKPPKGREHRETK